MSKIISTTIKEDNIPLYNELRKQLKRTNQSVGEYIIQSYIKSKTKTALDE